MSSNKMKYFTVTTTSVVKAESKTQAQLVALRKRGVPGTVLTSSTNVDQIRAAEANSLTA